MVIPPDTQVADEKSLESIHMAIRSWSFPGKEGIRIRVLVCSNGDEVELFVNGESCGRKPAGSACGYLTLYDVLYRPGLIEVINYRNRLEYSREVMQSDRGY